MINDLPHLTYVADCFVCIFPRYSKVCISIRCIANNRLKRLKAFLVKVKSTICHDGLAKSNGHIYNKHIIYKYIR